MLRPETTSSWRIPDTTRNSYIYATAARSSAEFAQPRLKLTQILEFPLRSTARIETLPFETTSLKADRGGSKALKFNATFCGQSRGFIPKSRQKKRKKGGNTLFASEKWSYFYLYPISIFYLYPFIFIGRF